MKAIVNHEYGPPAVLELEDVDTPVTRADEVLVRVLGAAVNPGVWDVMHGTPLDHSRGTDSSSRVVI
jgi:NADPH:quinone reductase-like Zn-dependent oxidoreductase